MADEDEQRRQETGKTILNTFNVAVGCFGVLGVLIAAVTLIYTISQPREVIRIIEKVAGLPTETPVDTPVVPSQTLLPTYTPPPTYTPCPTSTPYPTFTQPPEPSETPRPSATPTLSISLPFVDDFDQGIKPDWQMVNGTWRTVDGELTVTESKFEWAHILVGDPGWQDYVVEADYSLANDIYAMMGIVVRANSSSGLGLLFVTQAGWDVSAWKIWADSDWKSLASKDGSAETGHLRVEVRGNTFVGEISGLTQLTITDSSTSTGRVGLAIWCRGESGCPTFDHFRVSPLP